MKSHLKSEASVPQVIKDAYKELYQICDNFAMKFHSREEVFKLLEDFAKKHQMKLSTIETYNFAIFFFSKTIGIENFGLELMFLPEGFISLELKRSFQKS